jgi:hypothetical protein
MKGTIVPATDSSDAPHLRDHRSGRPGRGGNPSLSAIHGNPSDSNGIHGNPTKNAFRISGSEGIFLFRSPALGRPNLWGAYTASSCLFWPIWQIDLAFSFYINFKHF